MKYDTVIGTAVHTAADRCGLPPELRKIYVAWTACFHRFCEQNGMASPQTAAIGTFLAFLKDRPDTTEHERGRALDAVLFFFEEVADVPSPVLSALRLQHRRPEPKNEFDAPREPEPVPEPRGEALTRVMRLMDSERFRMHAKASAAS